MSKKFWAAGAALTIAALALPYGAAYAADEAAPTMTAQVTKATSASRQTSSEVTVEGTWATQKLVAGQSFTVASKDGGFRWQAGFPLPARRRKPDRQLHGKRSDAHKFGWTNADKSIGWGIKWAVEAGKTYTLTDETNKLPKAVKCSSGPTWDPATTTWRDGTLDESAHVLTFTPPAGSLVCVVYPAATPHVEGQDAYTNRATINGQSLEATATIKASGGTDGDGKTKPKPTPAPAPTPSDEPQSTPTPTPTPTTAPTPDTVKPSPKPEPTSTPTAEQTKPAPAPSTVPAPQEHLAKTGATADGLVLAIGIIAFGIGVGLVILRLLEGRKHDEETAR